MMATLSFRKQGLLQKCRLYVSLDDRLHRRWKRQYRMKPVTLGMMETCEAHILNESVLSLKRHVIKKFHKMQNLPEMCLA